MNLLVVLTFAALIAASSQLDVKRPEEYLSEWEDYKVFINFPLVDKVYLIILMLIKKNFPATP